MLRIFIRSALTSTRNICFHEEMKKNMLLPTLIWSCGCVRILRVNTEYRFVLLFLFVLLLLVLLLLLFFVVVFLCVYFSFFFFLVFVVVLSV